MSLPRCILLDFDDTLNVSNGKVDTHDASKIAELKVNKGTHELLDGFVRGCYWPLTVIVLTARREMCKEAIDIWVKKNYESLAHMRPIILTYPADGTSGIPAEQKKEFLYLNYIKDKYDVIFALDDNEECVKMYRSYNVFTLGLQSNKYI